MIGPIWLCERCRRPATRRDDIWDCPGCGKETCEHCFDRFGHCTLCAEGKSDVELFVAANLAGWDFEPPIEAGSVQP